MFRTDKRLNEEDWAQLEEAANCAQVVKVEAKVMNNATATEGNFTENRNWMFNSAIAS